MGGEQELVLLLAIGEGGDGGGGDIGGVELVDDAHVETTGSEQVLEVGTALGRRLGLGEDVLVGDIIVGEIGNKIVTEHLQVCSEGHLIFDRGTDWEHVGEKTDDFLKLSHRTLSDGSTNDEGVLSRVLVKEQVVDCEEGCEWRGGSSVWRETPLAGFFGFWAMMTVRISRPSTGRLRCW